MRLAPGAGSGVMLGLEARGSFTSEPGAREESVLRSGTKTLMNDLIRADFRFSYVDMSVHLRGAFRRLPRSETNRSAARRFVPMTLGVIATCGALSDP